MKPLMLTRPDILKKWAPVLEAKDCNPIRNRFIAQTVAQLLENTQHTTKVERQLLREDAPTSVTGQVGKWDPILISMVRRITPQLMHNDVVGVQPMNMPTGLVFAMRARYNNASGAEAFINEPNTGFTGATTDADSDIELDPFASPFGDPAQDGYTTGRGMATATGEGDISAEMTFTIESSPVGVKTRQLKATYSLEMAQDLNAVHGMDADSEFVALLQEELIQELNREITRTLYIVAKPGMQAAATPGTHALTADSDGRWLVEKLKTLMLKIDFEANQIFFETRRGRGNKLIVSANLGTALAQAGLLDYQGALTSQQGAMDVDPSKSTYVGKLNGMYDVHVDPWVNSVQFGVVGFRGDSPFDAGIFYCPYVPFQLLRATDPKSFTPALGFKTRYGLVANPFVESSPGVSDGQAMTANINPYYRKFKVTGL